MTSPLLEANSASLGAWTPVVNGVNVAYGEVVSLRLADVAGVRLWSLTITSADDETVRLGTIPIVTLNGTTRTATFTMPVLPNNGCTLRIQSVVGIANFGTDGSDVPHAEYTAKTVVCVLAPSGFRVIAIDQTLEGSAAAGWTKELNSLLRYPPGSTSIPSGPAGLALAGTYPNPSLAQRGAATGQALVWSGTDWLPGTNFGAQNVATTGTLGAGATTVTALTLTGMSTGILHSVAGVISSSLIVAADITATTITAAKLNAGGTSNRILLTTDGANITFGQVNLATAQVTGVLPVGNLPSIPVTSLAASGSEGQALINHSGVWTPSTDFSAQNLVTTGTLSVGSGAGRILFGVAAGIASIWGGSDAAAPTAGNASVVFNPAGGVTALNAATAINFAVGSVTRFQARSTGLRFMATGTYSITQQAALSDVAPVDLTFQSQAPFASATTQANRTPGNLVYDIAAPVGDGIPGQHVFKVSGTQLVAVQGLVGFPTIPAIYAGNIVPTSLNFALSSDGVGYTQISSPGYASLAQNGFDIFAGGSSVVAGDPSIGAFFFQGRAATLFHQRRFPNSPTFDFTIQSQMPSATATGTNRNSGNFILTTPAPVAGGVAGTFTVQIGAASAFVVNSVSKYTLFGAPTWTTGTAVPSSSEVDGSRYTRTGAPNGSEYLRQAGVWAQVGTAGGGTTLAGDVIGPSSANVVSSITGVDYGVGLTTLIHSPTFLWDEGISAALTISRVTTDNPTHSVNINGQQPSATATGLNRNPGSVVLNVAAPTTGGAQGFTRIKISSQDVATFGFYAASPSFPTTWTCLWMGLNGDAPGDTNFTLFTDNGHSPSANSRQTALNCVSTDGRVALQIAGLDVVKVKSDRMQFGLTQAALLEHQGAVANVAAFDFTFRSQAPFSGATGVNQNPGNLVYDIAAPVGAGLVGIHKFQVGGADVAQIGKLFGSTTANALYLSGATASATNFAIWSTATATSVNAPDGTSSVAMRVGGTLVAAFARVTPNVVGMSFSDSLAFSVGQIARQTDAACFDLSVIAQAPWAGGTPTGANKNSGNLVLGTAAPFSGGTAGSVFLKPNATTALEAAASGVITLPHYSTAGILHNDASGVVSSSPVVNADITNSTITPTKWDISGLADGQTWVRVSGVLVATTVGTGGGTLTGITAGAGLTGGGTSGTVTVDVVAGDLTLVVSANSMVVGTIGNANIAAGSIAYSKLALASSIVNGDIVSLAWTKITGAPTTLGGYGISDAAASSVTLTAGAGMTGGGNLTAGRTFNVVANADGSIVVNADDIQVGVITDTQHGNRSGGSLHPGATTTVAGFIKMTTDLAGTGASPIVVAITGSGDTAILRCNTIAWDSALASPTIQQSAIITASGHGAATTVSGQNSLGGGASIGGPLHLSSGFGATSGSVDFQLGGTTTLSLTAASKFQWDQAVNIPSFTQAPAASGNSGVATIHTAQDGVGTNRDGGDWQAFGGAKTGTGLRGGAVLGLGGAVVMFEATEIVTGKFVTLLNHLAFGSTAATGANPGSLVTFIGDCTSEPDVLSQPTGGLLAYSAAGRLRHKGKNNLVTSLAAGFTNSSVAFYEELRQDFSTASAGSGFAQIVNFRDYGGASGIWLWTMEILVTYVDLNDNSTGTWKKVYSGTVQSDSATVIGFSSLVQSSSGWINSPAPSFESVNVTAGSFGSNCLLVSCVSSRTDTFHWFVEGQMTLIKS